MPADMTTCSLMEEESERSGLDSRELVRLGHDSDAAVRGGWRRHAPLASAVLLIAGAAVAAWASHGGRGGDAASASAVGGALGLAQELDGPAAAADPCRDRGQKAGRRLKSEEKVKKLEGFLDSVKDELASRDDPCQLPNEDVLKVQQVINDEMESAELAAHKKAVNLTGCPAAGEDCRDARCCSDPGLQCYSKSEFWATCREECIPDVPDPADADADPWSCKKLGERTPGKAVDQEDCPDAEDNCLKSKCCKDAGSACFTKNDTFGRCLPVCTPGPQYADLDNGDPWSCHQVGPATPSTVGKWTQEECAGDEADCSHSRCCATSGFKCYEMNQGWAQCKLNCTKEPPEDRAWEGSWTCKELGYRTPPAPAALPDHPVGGKVGRWVKDACSKDGEDCSNTSCCVGRGKQCYSKDDEYATCADECNKNSTWSCKELGTKSFGLAYVGYPSLFCFALLRVDTYELDLVKYQWEKRSGIFACDSFRVFSDNVTTIAGRKTLQTPKVEVGVSKDGTAGNTLLFMKVWDMIFKDGTVWDHDWTIKADPDAVLLSDRLRGRLERYTNNWDHEGRLFAVNCNAWPQSPDFPMMYGAVEIFSQAAMRQYMKRVGHCMEVLTQWAEWGEDLFLTRCMDQIDVGRIEDYSLVGDKTCVGPGQAWNGDCENYEMAAFHPFKDIESWSECFDKAIR